MREDVLQRVRELSKELRTKELHLQELRTRAEQMTRVITGMPRSQNSQSQLEKAVCQLIEEEKRMEETLTELFTLQAEVTERIRTIENTSQRRVLQLRYLTCLSWNKIANVLEVSRSRLFQLHRQAVKNFFSSDCTKVHQITPNYT